MRSFFMFDDLPPLSHQEQQQAVAQRIWLYWIFTGFRISLRETELVRNDGLGELWHSLTGERTSFAELSEYAY